MRVAIPHGGLRTLLKYLVKNHHKYVAIPHGGLRTRQARAEGTGSCRSPSHAVGLELRGLTIKKLIDVASPSHAVGLELRGLTIKKLIDVASPSHMVGLELSLF